MTIAPPSVSSFSNGKLNSLINLGFAALLAISTLAAISLSVYVVTDNQEMVLVFTVPMAILFGAGMMKE